MLGHIDRLDELVDRARATHVMVAVSGDSRAELRPLLDPLANSDVAVRTPGSLSTQASAPLDLGTLIGPAGLSPPVVIDDGERSRPRFLPPVRGQLSWGRIAKRLVDIGVSAALLTLFAPLFAIVALAILISSGRPIFYMQQRVGQGGRLFRIYKFRSMRCDAERETGPIWASDHDTRCTRIGDWLRHTNIDELPQLINVLRGEMSLVGPRPERPIFVEEFRKTIPDYDLRHAVPGGMTGWAQVHGWARPDLASGLQYDLDYIEPLVGPARLPGPAHDLPARLLGQDHMERLEAPDAPGRLTGPRSAEEAAVSCSIVIPTYNAATCWSTPGQHRPAPTRLPARLPIEIVVVDNEIERRRTSEWLACAHPDVSGSSGWSRIRESSRAPPMRASPRARGVFVQLLNDDTEVTAGWVESRSGTVRGRHGRLGRVAPLVVVRSDPCKPRGFGRRLIRLVPAGR